MVGANGPGAGVDEITDFVPGTDLLVIDLAAFGVDVVGLGLASSGTVSQEAFLKGAGVRPLQPDDHFLFDTAQAVLAFDPDGSGPGLAVDLVRIFGPSADALTGGDLYVGV
jgi:hypothetical protein